MKEFLPWSNTVYQQSTQSYINGKFSILDIQLSGACNYNCIYCDSPDRNIPSNINISYLEQLLCKQSGQFQWMFICGLGEPLYGKNKVMLLQLLELCKKNNIRCTIFTNGSNIDEKILEYIKMGILFPLIKIDTFSDILAEKLYGTKQSIKNLSAINTLFDISKSIQDDYYHIAASIVPTSLNIGEIPKIVRRCIENNVFPLLGQLEYAGKAICNYNDLLLSKDELMNIKTEISDIIGQKYSVPICPSVISGIHINNNGYISVDEKSGLSCSWFWLETPNTINLCDINNISSLTIAEKEIFNYRHKITPALSEIYSQVEEHPFGGCGGNIKDLFNDYLKIQNHLIKEE